jgi:hypothetical protein
MKWEERESQGDFSLILFTTCMFGTLLIIQSGQVSYGLSSVGTAVILLVWAVLDALGVILMQSLQSACALSILQTGRWVIVTWLQGVVSCNGFTPPQKKTESKGNKMFQGAKIEKVRFRNLCSHK